VTLPVAGEIDALAALHRQRRYAAHLIAIRDTAVTDSSNTRMNTARPKGQKNRVSA
jgi:hypothetical protein